MMSMCEHEIIWITDKFYGVYPRVERGVCIKCNKEFSRVKEKGGTDNDKVESDAERNE